MGSLLSRSVEIQIFNNTRNITLKNPRTYFFTGHCSDPPRAQLRPGSSDSCYFPGSTPFWGCKGILVYEADSFTLAIHFYNPIDYNKSSMQLGLELSPEKAHLGCLWETYTRMANAIYSSSRLDIKFDRAVMCNSHGTTQVSAGPVKVTATMSNSIHSIIEVVLEERGGSGEEAGIEKPSPGRHYQEK